MRARFFFALFSLIFWLCCTPNLLISQEKKIPLKEALAFATEAHFVKWLDTVQFVDEGKFTLYYQNGFRFKLMPDGQLLRTKATIDHTKKTISWNAKGSGSRPIPTTLQIDDSLIAKIVLEGQKTEISGHQAQVENDRFVYNLLTIPLRFHDT